MADFRFQLVLQLPGHTKQDFEALVSLEESLTAALDGSPHEVDGHDFGSGTGNIFLDTNDPIGAFDLAKGVINLSDHPALKAAYRSFEEDDYTLIWPEDTQDEFGLI